jgi:hypothetical protein
MKKHIRISGVLITVDVEILAQVLVNAGRCLAFAIISLILGALFTYLVFIMNDGKDVLL